MKENKNEMIVMAVETMEYFQIEHILKSICIELKKAEEKHSNWPTNMYEQQTILAEEAGEVAKAVLHYHHENGSFEDIEEELIQTAAMCVRMLKNLKR